MSRTTIQCDVCGRETILQNLQPGRKVFCLHCGHKIMNSYQPGAEIISTPNDTSLQNNDSAENSEPVENNSPEPEWMSEPYIRINWNRIGYSIKKLWDCIKQCAVNYWSAIQKTLKRNQSVNQSSNSYPNESDVVPPPPPIPEPVQPESAQPELPFGYVDRRQLRKQQSFSNAFSDSGAIPASPCAPNYNQQRIDQSFANTFSDSGAIPASPSAPNYNQQRIDQSFSSTFSPPNNANSSSTSQQTPEPPTTELKSNQN